MKKLLITTLAALSLQIASAQQLPLFSQYYFNSFIYNPSHTGQKAGTSVNVVGRKQYTGLANSIGTAAASLQTRIADQRSGFGVYVYNDNTNLFRTNSATGSYGYHIPLSNERTLSFGLGLSVLDHRYNASNFHIIREGDPVLALLGNDGGISFDANAGVNMDFGKFSMGLANLQMFQNQEAFKNNSGDKTLYTLANNWMLNASYLISINDDWELEPYMMYRKTKAAPGQVDMNLFLNWINRGYAGIAYRDGMSFSTMIGVNVSQVASIGYAYDLTTNQYKSALGNTHEVALRFNWGGNSKSTANEELLASEEKEKYDAQIGELKNKIRNLESKEPTTSDTVYIEKIVVKEVTPTAPDITKPSPTPINNGLGYYVIAGSFDNAGSANAYIKTLGVNGTSAFQKYDATNKRYYVHVGDFETKEEAVNRIQELKSMGLPLWVKAM
jgi:type IX secretion system PorP/SprF family membrane protein